MNHTLIVGGGFVNPEQLKNELANEPEMIIAADRGGSYLLDVGTFPQTLIGDNDSIPPEALTRLISAGVEIISYPPGKDETDMELALNVALSRGAKEINILGGLGRRFDHTLGNIGLLVKALENGARAFLLDENHIITAINRRITLQKKPGWAVSLIPLTLKVSGVTTSGLVFELKNEELFFQRSRGLHNEFAQEVASVQLSRGILLVISFRV